MPEELRVQFHRDLETINAKVVRLYAHVAEGLAAATDAFLAGDREAAREIVARDRLIDDLYLDVEGLVQHQFATQAPIASDLRFLLTILRIVPELERCHDLVAHIAKAAARGLSGELSPRARGLVEELGRISTEMWREAAEAFVGRDPDAAERLDARDDEIDELRTSLVAEITAGATSIPVAADMVLVARYYERLGDHAVKVSRRVRFLATGEA